MPLTRGILSGLGLEKDQIDAIMNAREEILEGYVTVKASEQASATAVTEALEAAKKDAPGVPDVSKDSKYIKLQGDFDAFKKRTDARGSDDFKGIKGKFFDSVYDRLDHEKPYKEQIEALKKDCGEFFGTEARMDAVAINTNSKRYRIVAAIVLPWHFGCDKVFHQYKQSALAASRVYT